MLCTFLNGLRCVSESETDLKLKTCAPWTQLLAVQKLIRPVNYAVLGPVPSPWITVFANGRHANSMRGP